MRIYNAKKAFGVERFLGIILLTAIMLTGCSLKNDEAVSQEALPASTDNTVVIEHDSAEKDTVQILMDNMTLSDMIYQMMFVTPEKITNVKRVVRAGEATRKALETYPVGGIVYFASNFVSREQTAEMISNTMSYSEIPLFIGVDEEGGRVSRLGGNPAMNITLHPPMGKIGASGDAQKAYSIGSILGSELSGLGFNVNFAPDADIIVNSENTEIGDRSFGTDPRIVSAMVENVVRGLEENGVSAALKHFPGHGSTHVDSHTSYSSSDRALEQLMSCEFLPFEAGIKAGADFVMVSHMTLTNATEEKVASSLSKEVITDMLAGRLGFEGIIITDSFSMGAITKVYSVSDAAVKAVKAGADMILMPSDLAGTHSAILTAVESGEIPPERIEHSVRKILSLKLEKGMIKAENALNPLT